MEKKSSCCSRSYASTPKKEPVAVTPKKEEVVTKGNVPAPAAAVADAAVKTPKTEQKEPVKANVVSGGNY
ncbi:hypothetical protein COLO4_04143 [Corchorus olitorius]|uniref:Uncharacterized protein n=1 Tax=Corchorus olitorius TaxID=93759 RepID=A0A1R3KV46_9ROSI|nr:hypothetical protein COLO4_04143 [Corchorus olitorius]